MTTNKIEGNALYLELVANPELSEDDQRKYLGWQNDSVKQVIIFPVTELPNGLKKGVVMSRVVGKYSSKAQWDFEVIGDGTGYGQINLEAYDKFLADKKDDGFGVYRRLDSSIWDSYSVEQKARSSAIAIESYIRDHLVGQNYDYDKSKYSYAQAWSVRENKPFAVEFTTEDLELATDQRTPQAVIRRINKVRGTLDNFPEKLVSSS